MSPAKAAVGLAKRARAKRKKTVFENVLLLGISVSPLIGLALYGPDPDLRHRKSFRRAQLATLCLQPLHVHYVIRPMAWGHPHGNCQP